jgi:hypothetical protein
VAFAAVVLSLVAVAAAAVVVVGANIQYFPETRCQEFVDQSWYCLIVPGLLSNIHLCFLYL